MAIFKIVSVSPDGNEAIQYIDAEGRPLASAIGGGEVREFTQSTSTFGNTFHIPSSIPNPTVTITVQGAGYIYNIIKQTYTTYYPQISLESGTHAIVAGFFETTNISQITYPIDYQNYSYNYYNDMGELVVTVAPEGVNFNSTAYPAFVTTYEYDHLGRSIAVTAPDEGTSKYVYSLDGKIRFSQNEEQGTQNPPRFSYTNYDEIGRLIESGDIPCQEQITLYLNLIAM